MSDWYSAKDFRAHVDELVRNGGFPPLTDAEFYEQTWALLNLGMLKRETRHGIKGLAVLNEGVAVVPMRGH